jgi:hypothetical protein
MFVSFLKEFLFITVTTARCNTSATAVIEAEICDSLAADKQKERYPTKPDMRKIL